MRYYAFQIGELKFLVACKSVFKAQLLHAKVSQAFLDTSTY